MAASSVRLRVSLAGGSGGLSEYPKSRSARRGTPLEGAFCEEVKESGGNTNEAGAATPVHN
eukprot:9485920-Pyramimonas_sp.AAC.1